jgi:hypothetical protein
MGISDDRQCQKAPMVEALPVAMEPIETDCIDAYQFALACRLDNLSLYREEMLCFNMIPGSCLLAGIPAKNL